MRALACLGVLLYHTWPQLLPGGFLGVDVFFVISGFLITSLLVKELETTGKLQMRRFWLRRWRRLFPAVFTLVVLCVPLAGIVNLDLLAKIRPQILGAWSFSYNWVQIIQGNDYFDQRTPMLLTNLWTLAVEQQFYWIWPIVVVVTFQIHRRARPLIPVILSVVSLDLTVFYLQNGAGISRAYLGSDAHAYGLMIGAGLAFALNSPLNPAGLPDRACSAWISAILAWVGLGGVAVLFCTVSDQSPLTYPWLTLLLVLATALVLQALVDVHQLSSTPAHWLSRCLELGVLRWIGLRSYGIYLWHWPLLIIWKDLFPSTPPWLTTITILSLACLLAALSFKLIETPMRRQGIIRTLGGWFGLNHKHSPEIRQVAREYSSAVVFWRRAPRCALFSCLTLFLLAAFIWPTVLAPQASELEQAFGRLEDAPSTISQTEGDLLAGENSSPQDGSLQETAAPNGDEPSSSAPASSTPLAISGENIIVIGDSVTAMCQGTLETTWPGIVVDGQKNRNYTQVPQLLTSYRDAGQLRHYVVVSVAVNAAIRMEHVENWLEIIGPERKLILVTGHGTQSEPWIDQSNQTIIQAAQSYPDQVSVAPYRDQVTAHPDSVYRDQVHPRPEGEYLYAEAIDQGLQSAFNQEN